MLGLDWGELLVIIIVAVVVIGPKDMPLALRTAGRWIARVRRVSNHFKSGLETMIREAEMEEMEQKWAAQNERIVREHPGAGPFEMEPTGAYPSPPASPPEASTETAVASAADGEEPQLPLGKRK
jgi:sec-independent protein translocase protein TatB